MLAKPALVRYNAWVEVAEVAACARCDTGIGEVVSKREDSGGARVELTR